MIDVNRIILTFTLPLLINQMVSATELTEAPLETFSIAVIPDTQHYREQKSKSRSDSSKSITNPIFEAYAGWIAANLEKQKIVFVSHVGDIVDINNREQWTVARRHMDLLHGRVPYGISVGNHDMTRAGDSSLFQEFFPAERFVRLDWYGGHFRKLSGRPAVSGNNANSYQLFSACGMDFVFLHLECNAPDDVLAWADSVLKKHSKRRAIITTHMGLGPREKPKKARDYYDAPKGRMQWKKCHGERGNTPQQMWDKCFRKHANLFMICCGDQSRTQALHQSVHGDHNNVVHEVLSDYGTNGMRIMRFIPNKNRIEVRTWNPITSQLCLETSIVRQAKRHQFNLEYIMSPAPKKNADRRETDQTDTWHQFRGPNGSGIATDSKPPLKIDSSKPSWKVPTLIGHSSPVISDRRIFLTGVKNDRLVILAYEKSTGKLAWHREAPKVNLEKVHEANSPAAPTPALDNDRLYVYFGSYGMLCYDHDGKELWKKPIPAPRTLYGTSSSPITYKDLIILVLDDDNNLPRSRLSKSKLLALKKATGETAWETPRPFQRSGWSTPIIWNHGNQKELVVLGNGRLTGYDLLSGQEKWFVTGFSRETISSPVASNGLVFASASKRGGGGNARVDPEPFWKSIIVFDTNGDKKLQRSEMIGHFTFPFRPELPLGHPGFGMPLPKDKRKRNQRLDGIFGWMDKNRDGFWSHKEFTENFSHGSGKPLLIAVRPGGKGNITDSHVEWELNRGIPEIPSPVLFKNRLYMVRSGGLLSAVDAATGKPLYSERLGSSGQYSASPVIANGHLYLASEPGQITIAKTGNKFEILHQHKLGESIHVSPAFDESTLYIRSTKHLWAFRKQN